MSNRVGIHEAFMNRSGIILPRVGVGVGGRGELAEPCMPLTSLGAAPNAARHLASQPHTTMRCTRSARRVGEF